VRKDSKTSMKQILYISMMAPYYNVSHAGGKTFYYYLSNIQNDGNKYTLIAKKLKNEKIEKKGLENVSIYLVENKKFELKHILSYVIDILSKINIFRTYGTTLRQSIYSGIIKIIKQEELYPDIIILEFTEMVLLAKKLKKFFPETKIIASEHDVSYLGMYRKVNSSAGPLKIISYIKYKIRKKYELEALSFCDKILPHNEKDKKLLISDGVSERKIMVLTPYYDVISKNRESDGKTIIYYGAMSRQENKEAAIWFVKNVMTRLVDLDITFFIIGGNPDPEVLSLSSDRVVVTGFVEDPSEYFDKAMCLVAPLFHGAGIKVKILEGLVSGVPVITNEIGIEGIAEKYEDIYIYANTEQEYEDAIRRLYSGKMNSDEISKNLRRYIKEKFDLHKSLLNYRRMIDEL